MTPATDQRIFIELDPGAPIREQPRSTAVAASSPGRSPLSALLPAAYQGRLTELTAAVWPTRQDCVSVPEREAGA